MKKSIFYSFLVFTVLSVISCNTGKSPLENGGNSSLNKDNGPKDGIIDQGANLGPVTNMEFEEPIFDFGTVEDGEKVIHIYKFKNLGTEPLVIANAKASCGCTVPDWPKDPIEPGKSGEIKVQFDSSGKGGEGGAQTEKRITVTANTNPPQSFLTIRGKVKSKAGAKPTANH